MLILTLQKSDDEMSQEELQLIAVLAQSGNLPSAAANGEFIADPFLPATNPNISADRPANSTRFQSPSNATHETKHSDKADFNNLLLDDIVAERRATMGSIDIGEMEVLESNMTTQVGAFGLFSQEPVGEGSEVLEVLNPVAVPQGDGLNLAPRLPTLEGKRVAFFWNSKPGGGSGLAADRRTASQTVPGYGGHAASLGTS